MDVADGLRVLAVLVGGASFSIGVVVVREWVTRMDGFAQLAALMFGVVHFLVVTFVALSLAEHSGEPLSWRTPIALTIFTLKVASLELARRVQRDTYLREDPPQRRAQDKAT